MKNARRVLLKILHEKAPIEVLVKKGLQYAQIFELINECLSNEYVVYEGSSLVLTERGYEYISSTQRVGIDRVDWIEAEEESRIERIGEYEVYIPSAQTVKKLLN